MSYLYHYTSYASLLKILETRSLRFGKLENTNDPKEYMTPYISGSSFNQFGPKIHLYQDKIHKELHNYQLICFSLDKNIPGYGHARMWAQYAQNHEGCCICFNKEKLEEQFNKLKDQFKLLINSDIEYTGNLEVLDFNYSENIQEFVKHNLNHFLFTKNSDWSNEAEHRFLLYSEEDKEVFISIDDALEGFYFGHRFSEVLMETVMNQFIQPKKYTLVTWHNGFCVKDRTFRSHQDYLKKKIDNNYKGKLCFFKKYKITEVEEKLLNDLGTEIQDKISTDSDISELQKLRRKSIEILRDFESNRK